LPVIYYPSLFAEGLDDAIRYKPQSRGSCIRSWGQSEWRSIARAGPGERGNNQRATARLARGPTLASRDGGKERGRPARPVRTGRA